MDGNVTDQVARLGIFGFIAVSLILTAVFAVVYGVVVGETETTKAFATALSGPGIGGLLVAVGRFFGGDSR